MPRLSTVPGPPSSGSPEWVVPLSELNCGETEMHEVMRVLRSGWWTCGPETDELEREFERRLGVRHAVAVSSGTAALHLAFRALGFSDGAEVVTPSFTFVAAANTLMNAGAVPRFADVESMVAPVVSAATLERALTPETRGICVMHYGGYPCEMNSIMDLARRRNLRVVEDAAHAPGASLNGIACGRWGDVGCFSFFGNKNLTCAEGGLVVTEDDDLAGKIRLLRSHGMSSLTWDRFRGHSFSYDVTEAGFNFRMDDVRAALARVQLEQLDRWNDLRKERVGWYRGMLGADPRWSIVFEKYEGSSAFHLFAVVLEKGISRTHVMRYLKSKGIQSSIHYPPIHQFSYYAALPFPKRRLPVTDSLGSRILTLPLFPSMTYEQVALVSGAFREAVDDAGTCRQEVIH